MTSELHQNLQNRHLGPQQMPSSQKKPLYQRKVAVTLVCFEAELEEKQGLEWLSS